MDKQALIFQIAKLVNELSLKEQGGIGSNSLNSNNENVAPSQSANCSIDKESSQVQYDKLMSKVESLEQKVNYQLVAIQKLEKENSELKSALTSQKNEENNGNEMSLAEAINKNTEGLDAIKSEMLKNQEINNLLQKKKNSALAKKFFNKAENYLNDDKKKRLELYESAFEFEKIGLNDSAFVIKILNELEHCYGCYRRCDKEIEVLTRWVDVAPSVENYWKRACAYRNNLQNYELALKDFEKILKLDPNHKEAKYWRNFCLGRLDRM